MENLRGGFPPAVVDLALFTPGLIAGLLLQWQLLAAVLLGGVTYVSSSGVIAKALADLRRLENPETPAAGRIGLGRKKINFSTVFAGQAVGIKEVHDDIWLVSFMEYDLGYFDLEMRVLEPQENPFGPKVYPCSRYVV